MRFGLDKNGCVRKRAYRHLSFSTHTIVRVAPLHCQSSLFNIVKIFESFQLSEQPLPIVRVAFSTWSKYLKVFHCQSSPLHCQSSPLHCQSSPLPIVRVAPPHCQSSLFDIVKIFESFQLSEQPPPLSEQPLPIVRVALSIVRVALSIVRVALSIVRVAPFPLSEQPFRHSQNI